MNQQDQQAIDELFRYLYRTAQQAGPRDADAEALIQRYVKQAPPGLIYQMAQTLVAQQATIRQLRARLQGGGAPAGFGQPQQAYGQPGYGYQPGPYQQGYQQPYPQQGRGGGFLAGAGQLALGIGGGIIGAEILTSIFSGAGDLFDGDRGDYDRDYGDGYQDGFAAGDDYRDDNGGQDYGQDQGGYDDGGGGDFGGGDF